MNRDRIKIFRIHNAFIAFVFEPHLIYGLLDDRVVVYPLTLAIFV